MVANPTRISTDVSESTARGEDGCANSRRRPKQESRGSSSKEASLQGLHRLFADKLRCAVAWGRSALARRSSCSPYSAIVTDRVFGRTICDLATLHPPQSIPTPQYSLILSAARAGDGTVSCSAALD